MVHPSLEQLRVYAHCTGPADPDLEAHVDSCPSCETLFVSELVGLKSSSQDEPTLDEILTGKPLPSRK